tara:strand:+ start:1537 stop:2316 length:780 start_codon:yes stop_codon:yes gene_type:complete
MIPPPQTQSYSAPTEFVDLPSKGAFYPEGHPLFGQGRLEIKFMTTREEDILNSRSLLRENEAVNRMIQNIIVNPEVAVDSLLPADRNAIMVAARSSGYGDIYKTSVRCGDCGESHEREFNLQEMRNVRDPDHDESISFDNGLIVMRLPKSGATVNVKVLTVADEKDLTYAQKVKEKNNLPDTSITDLLTTMVVSINGNPDRAYIASAVAGLPIMDARFIRQKYDECTPQLDLSTEVDCPHCGATERRMMPFTADFFWPK